MKKTNNKEVLQKIRNYIKETCEDVEGGYMALVKYFNDNNKYDYLGEKNLVSFIRNTGTAFPIYYSEMRSLLKNWLEETEEEALKYSDDKVEKLFDNLVEMQFLKMFKLRKSTRWDFRNKPGSKSYLVIIKQ